MANSFGKGIVTGGLVLHLDAGNVRSYPGTGTNWYDISGNDNHGVLANGPIYSNGAFTFDGADDSTTFATYAQPAHNSASSFTWNIWVYARRNSNADVLMGNGTDLTYRFIKLTTRRIEYFPNGTSTVVDYLMPLSRWQNVCAVKSGENLLYYLNSVLVASGTNSVACPSYAFYVGGDPVTGQLSTASIAHASVYHRALTQSEIQQNFEALRGRYGI